MNDDHVYDAIDYLSAALDNNKKERMIDELLGESKAGKSGQVLTGKSGSVKWEWEDVSSEWQDAHYRSKY